MHRPISNKMGTALSLSGVFNTLHDGTCKHRSHHIKGLRMRCARWYVRGLRICVGLYGVIDASATTSEP